MKVQVIDAGGIIRPITPSGTNLVHDCKVLRADTAGTLVLKFGSADSVTLNVTAGEVIPAASPFLVLTASTATVHGFFDR